MKILVNNGWVVMVLASLMLSSAQADSTVVNRLLLGSEALEISGFGDFRVYLNENASDQRFTIGAAEMALAYQLNERASSQMSIAYANSAFGIGSFTLDYQLAAGDRSSTPIKSLNVKAGQFDIPVGIDWQRYASPDRNLISTPRMVSNLHGAWNDLGVAFDLATDNFKLAAFAANGFCFEGTSSDGAELHTENRLATGGRFGIAPVAVVEVGASVAQVFGKSGSADINLVGFDIRADLNQSTLRAEIMREQLDGAGHSSCDNSGYYVEFSQQIGQWVLALQREQLWSDELAESDYSGMLLGIGRQLGERITARWETRYDFTVKQFYGTGQLVMQF